MHAVCRRRRAVQYQKRGDGKDAGVRRSALERRLLNISRTKTEILRCSERDDLDV